MIKVKGLTMTYPSGKGIFDLNFTIRQGEVMGYLGPNGAGKTTTIRALLGFMKPDSGTASIGGLDCWKRAPEIQKTLGYIPGETAFPDGMDGSEFLKFMHDMRGTKDFTRQRQLTEMFELNPKGRIRKFSKGMKQKLGIVAAFMHDPDVLILDEPTSGLDPLMQNRFVELVLSEKQRGKTILMSSHMFEEVEKTCDNVLIIKEGRIVRQSDVPTLKSSRRRSFLLKTAGGDTDAGILRSAGFEVNTGADGTMEVFVTGQDVDRFVKTAAQFTVRNLDVKAQTLEDIFIEYYSREEKGS